MAPSSSQPVNWTLSFCWVAGPWDIAALVPIVQEAGGVFSDLAGRQRIDTGEALFARPGLHRQLLRIAASG